MTWWGHWSFGHSFWELNAVLRDKLTPFMRGDITSATIPLDLYRTNIMLTVMRMARVNFLVDDGQVLIV
jgi:hypothetical protein